MPFFVGKMLPLLPPSTNRKGRGLLYWSFRAEIRWALDKLAKAWTIEPLRINRELEQMNLSPLGPGFACYIMACNHATRGFSEPIIGNMQTSGFGDIVTGLLNAGNNMSFGIFQIFLF